MANPQIGIVMNSRGNSAKFDGKRLVKYEIKTSLGAQLQQIATYAQ